MTDFAGNMRCDAKPPILNSPTQSRASERTWRNNMQSLVDS